MATKLYLLGARAPCYLDFKRQLQAWSIIITILFITFFFSSFLPFQLTIPICYRFSFFHSFFYHYIYIVTWSNYVYRFSSNRQSPKCWRGFPYTDLRKFPNLADFVEDSTKLWI
ncbi:hypothetical protein J3Q64DRAFT_1733537 [Phycomyces blakesleeanus]|uniref:Uncharacterized protein n=1 Tax=Phycomyces blakesleeanus TaxID=4837 RepID=A0ABR3B1X8_PHYBL